MRLLRALSGTVVFMAASGFAVVVTAGTAAAHEHPTPVELVSPAVVRVETYARVNVSLIEHNRAGAHIGLMQRTYTPLLAEASGFAVEATGAVVTTAKAINVNRGRAEIFAINSIFHERYGDAAPLPADPFTRHRIRDINPSDRTAQRLQRCYQPNGTDDTGGCVVFSELLVKVLPFVSSQRKYGDLTATPLFPTAGKSGDVVVLKVGASSMPTVDLATSTEGVTAFSILGFPDVPSDGRSLQKVDGHFVQAGAPQVKRDDDYAKLVPAMTAGLLGGPVVGEKGQVVGFLTQQPGQSGDASSGLALVGPAAIRAALTAARVTPQRGPTDAVFEQAMHNYKNKHYTPAIPSLNQTLKLYPGHALAAEALAAATAKRGTAEEVIDGSPDGTAGSAGAEDPQRWRTVVPLTAGIGALLIAVAAVGLLLRRSWRRPATSQVAHPGAGVATGPLPAPRQGRGDQPRPEGTHQHGAGVRPGATVESVPSDPGRAGGPASAGESTREIRRDEGAPDACPRCGEPISRTQTFCGRCRLRLR